MAYPDNELGLWQEIRDTINYNDNPTDHYPNDIDGILHHIRDLLNISLLGTTTYPNDRLGILQNIRDLLNTEHASTAAYSADVSGVLLNIRDLLNADDDATDVYPIGNHGVLQAARDFVVASGWPQSGDGGGGGGDEIIIDLEHGAYSVNGEAVELSTLLGEDTDEWGAFDPDNIVDGTGLVSPDVGGTGCSPIFIGAARTALIAGATIVADLTSTGMFHTFLMEFFSPPEWNTDLLCRVAHNVPIQVVDLSGETSDPGAAWDSSDYRAAFTVSAARMSCSGLGEDANTIGAPTITDAISEIGMSLSGTGATVRKIRIIPAQDDADLPALSQVT